ncbi:polysaccharide deacetylase family sporulation protein PdaB [Bacillus sp. OAE603]|uniref:polysaccharide deacetylase family sporulation protein PdaB n=1 Tax=Gottfriedia sp. OAE603 TaxID=2663872 RepID=UPI00178B8C73
MLFYFYITSKRKLKQISLITIIAFFTACLVYIQAPKTFSTFSTSKGPMAIYKGDASRKNIALTFDISWGDENAVKVLEVLKNQRINNATFFLSASWAERHPEIVETIVKQGHEIGTLGYRYKSYTQLTTLEMQRDLNNSAEVFKRLGVKDVKLFRPPNGEFNKEVIKVASRYNLSVVHWSINTEDWRNPGTNQIFETVKENTNPGDIILLHASDSALQTPKAIPLIISYLRDKGYKNVSVSQMISNTKTKTKVVN